MVWSCVRVEAPVSKEILSICMVCVECFQLLRPTELAIYVAFVFCHFVLVAPHPPLLLRWEGTPRVTFQRPLANKGFL